MNQEQLNDVVDLLNAVRAEEKICIGDDPIEFSIKAVFSAASCYLYAYKNLYPENYDTVKNALQNLLDMFTLGINIEDMSYKDGEFSMETQHLVYMGDNK